MGLFLLVVWCSIVVGRHGSRFGDFNFRLGRREFPVRGAAGICRQGLDLLYRLREPNGGFVGKIDEIPVSTGKTGNFCPPTAALIGAGALKAIEGNRNFVFPWCVLALGCARLGRGGLLRKRCAGWSALHRISASARCPRSGLPTRRASNPTSICCDRRTCPSDGDRRDSSGRAFRLHGARRTRP